MSKCRKKGKCYHCPNPITNGNYMVVCKVWKSKDGVLAKFPFKMRFHVDCWVARGKAAIDNKPRAETRGRRKLDMSDATRLTRLKIMRRRASVVQRIRACQPEQVDRIIHLGSLLHNYREEIEKCGGAPELW